MPSCCERVIKLIFDLPLQMILEAIVPAYLKHLQTSAGRKDPRTEKDILHQLGVAIKTLISNAETLTKCVDYLL